MADLTRADIEQGFEELGEHLRRQHVIGEIAVYGGAAMVLHFQINRMTNDVDAIIGAEHTAVQRAVREIGQRHGWGESWLNEGVSIYLSKNNDIALFKSYPSTGGVGLRVYVASPRYMLAMKLASLRTGVGQRDVDDVMRLAREIGVSTTDELLAVHKAYFPNHPLDARKIVIVGEIAEQLNAPPPAQSS